MKIRYLVLPMLISLALSGEAFCVDRAHLGPTQRTVADPGEAKLNIATSYVSRDGKKKGTKLDGATLRDGDLYKIVITPQEDGFLYVFQKDSEGISVLFPSPHYDGSDKQNHQSLVYATKSYFLPAAGRSFELDDATGEEEIYIAFSEDDDPVLRKSYEKIVKVSSSDQEKQAALDKVRESYGPKRATVKDDVASVSDKEGLVTKGQPSQVEMCPEDDCYTTIKFNHRSAKE